MRSHGFSGRRKVLLYALVFLSGFVIGGDAVAQESEIVRDVRTYATWISKALNASGYKADFTMESLKEIDRFFDEQSRDGKPLPGGLLSENLGARVFGLGAYVGETIRRQGGGTWKGDDSDPEAEINVELHLPDGTRMWPMQRVMKRLTLGDSDLIYPYGVVALEHGAKP